MLSLRHRENLAAGFWRGPIASSTCSPPSPNPHAIAEWSGPVGAFIAQRNVHK
jgi:hypothetical protein